MPNLKEIARTVAIESIASGIADFGPLYQDEWCLTDAEWAAVCDEAERMLPTVRVPASVYASWSQVNRDIRAEAHAEQRMFGGE